MPKTLLEKIVFTVVMAAIMVYGMIVYNVALATGGVTNATFGMALHEMPIYGAGGFRAGVLRGGKAGDCAGLHLHTPHRPAAVHHLCHLSDDRLHHVPCHEPCGNGAVQGAQLRYVGAYVRHQFPDGSVLADVLLRPAVPLHLPCYLPPRWTERPVSLYPIL